MTTPIRKEELRRMQRQLAAYAAELSASTPKNITARELAGRAKDAERSVAALLNAWPDDWPEAADRYSGPVKAGHRK